MSTRSKPPFRADHVGSLLRPAELAAKRKQWHAGEASQEELRDLENSAIRDVVKLQEDVGLNGITDGEFRRDYWHLDFMWGFDGVEPSAEAFTAAFSGGEDFVAPAARRFLEDFESGRHNDFRGVWRLYALTSWQRKFDVSLG